MSDVTPDRVELSEHKTHNKVLLAVVGGLCLVVNGIFTYNITSASSEMRETNRNLVEVNASLRVIQAQQGYTNEQVRSLQDNKKEADKVHKEIDTRLDALEQGLALHNQWIQAHNN